MKKRLEQIKQNAAEMFDLPKEAFLNISRIIMISNTVLLIENHRGIIEYTLMKIRIMAAKNQITIRGIDLEVKDIGKESMIVSGIIKSIEFVSFEVEK